MKDSVKHLVRAATLIAISAGAALMGLHDAMAEVDWWASDCASYPTLCGQDGLKPQTMKSSHDMAVGGMSKTVVSSPHVIVGVFKKMEEGDPSKGVSGLAQAGQNLPFTFPNNDYARSIADDFSKLSQELPRLQGHYDAAFQPGGAVDQINAFLDGKNIFGMKTGLKLSPSGDPSAVSAAALLDIRVEWQNEGKSVDALQLAQGGSVPGVIMSQGVRFFKGQEGQAVARIDTKSGDQVFLTRFTGSIPDDSATAALQLAQRLDGSLGEGDYYTQVEFPKVKFEHSGDVPELIGTKTIATAGPGKGREYFVKQFKLMQRLYINEKGALAQAAGAGQIVTRSIHTERPLVIDGPFLVWFKVNGVIAYAGVISKESMQDPGSF